MSIQNAQTVVRPASFLQNLQKVLRQNIREYGMFIALFLIMAFFAQRTGGTFVSARNLSNLLNQTGYIAVLAVGMTLVIVIRQIDLSVGFLAGFLGAVAAIALSTWGLPVFVVIPMVLILGLIAGLITAFPVAQLGIPSFVASLAGWLIYRGFLQQVTEGTGTIIIKDETFNALGNGFIPDIPGLGGVLEGVHKLTLVLGVLAIILYIYSASSRRSKQQAYNFEVMPRDVFILQMAFVALLIGAVTWVLATYQGLSWTTVIMLLVVGIYHFVTTRTVLGRHIYAVGGNPDAAELSGISVKRILYTVFGSMGMLSALSGILFAARLTSASTTAGTLFELDAIAAAYVGGVSAAGGVGRVTGSIIGALVMTSLINGMNLMGVGISYQYIVRGAVLAAAVIFDVYTRRTSR
ncbi:ABC transporter permease [Kouleothrix aurantiaca]|jgi:putative multiple sugar transport system permease protein|uniref:Xylose transport system permease protein XylH n=1 Tax=Kouleothrix aurantiaca TaxID=186479 RepID=A0A0P9DJ97_9CHLR|nr:ABC transporter permease [Kouleothrix aurantiaca]